MGNSNGAMTHTEHKHGKEVAGQKRVAEALEHAQQKNALINALNITKVD